MDYKTSELINSMRVEDRITIPYDGEDITIECVEDNCRMIACGACLFVGKGKCIAIRCSFKEREDAINVHFEKVEEL